METRTTARADVVTALRGAIRGRVIAPGDAEYDAARAIFYGGVDPRPAAIARVTDATDVAHAIAVARDSGLELAVRSGGHSSAAHGTVDGGIVIDLRDLRELEIDPDARTARVGTGLTAREVTDAAFAHGLGVGFGDTGSVGVGGITLGGGVGYLARKYGLTIDSLLEAEVVTADGAVIRTSETEEPELFWAIRGGGGNFGVATRFVFRLHPVDPTVGGLLVLPATPDTIVGFMDAAQAAPEELSGIANVMPAPPLPFLPQDVVGTPVIFSMLVHVGDVDAGQAALAPFRSLATPLADLTRPMPYPEVYPPDDESDRPTASSRTMFVDGVDRPAAERIIDALHASDAPLRVAQLRVLGGAVARLPADATAFAHRSSPIMVYVAAFWEGEDDRPRREAWVADLASALHTGDDGAYVNFLGDEGPDRVRAAYPGATWERLRAAKRRYDPTNLFHRNQNITPG